MGIVGAGLMGGGIAMCVANAGIRVEILDVDEASLERGMGILHANYDRSRSMTAEAKRAAKALIHPTTDYSNLRQCDLVIEAVFEDMDVKKSIFSRLDKICRSDALLCTNTSALDIDEIAGACSAERRKLVMGIPFFSPANVMKLLENVRGLHTSAETVSTVMEFGERIGKHCILAGNCEGFVGNRMIALYTQAAREALESGALPLEVDAAALDFGMKLGPFAMQDLVGLDLGIQAWKKQGIYSPDTVPQHALIELGRKGQKTRSGWYDYDANRRRAPSPVVTNLLRKMYPLSADGATATPSLADIQQSLFMPMINEGFRILEEGMARGPADVDTCLVYGYSFPKDKGGPLAFADRLGLRVVRDSLRKMGVKPASLLEQCVGSDQSLVEFWESSEGARGAWERSKSEVHVSRRASRARARL